MIDTELHARTTAQGLLIPLHVVPRAKICEISGLHNGALRVKVKAPPVEDAANRAVVEFFAHLLGIPKTGLKIVSGLKSKNKVLQIRNLSLSDFLNRLGTIDRHRLRFQ